MKLILIVIITLISTFNVRAAGVKFYIVSHTKSQTPEEYTIGQAFTTEFSKIITQSFPCVDMMDDFSITELIRWERMRQLLGSGSDEDLQNIAGSLGAEYLVKFSINSIGSQYYMNVFCANTKKSEVIAKAEEKCSVGDAVSKIIQMSKDIEKQLEEYEICPFYGPLTIEVKSELEDSQTDNMPAPCGSGDMVTITSTKKANSTLKWELNKYTTRAADGNATYDLKEKMTIVSNYSCYKCKNGDQGAAKITETNESEAKVQGLSDESVSDGMKVKDARIKLVFLDDGTYTVLVEATSKQGNMKVTKERKVEGICESESEPKDTKNKKIDVPIKVVLGPYKGTIKDNSLHQNETKDLSDGKEKTTVKIDFTLTRKN